MTSPFAQVHAGLYVQQPLHPVLSAGHYPSPRRIKQITEANRFRSGFAIGYGADTTLEGVQLTSYSPILTGLVQAETRAGRAGLPIEAEVRTIRDADGQLALTVPDSLDIGPFTLSLKSRPYGTKTADLHLFAVNHPKVAGVVDPEAEIYGKTNYDYESFFAEMAEQQRLITWTLHYFLTEVRPNPGIQATRLSLAQQAGVNVRLSLGLHGGNAPLPKRGLADLLEGDGVTFNEEGRRLVREFVDFFGEHVGDKLV